MDIPAAYTIATAEQSRHIDSITVNQAGISSFTLMEVAGSSAARSLLHQLQPGSHGVFLCGKGNNGGDALVVARYLAQHGIRITIVFVGGTDLSPDAAKNRELLQSIADNDSETSIAFYNSWDDFDPGLHPDFIVDGMLGTGLDSELRGDFTGAVAWANDNPAPVTAMDIPTGLHADHGAVMGSAVWASRTFAFGTLKQGFYLGKGPEVTGHIEFCELPFPRYLQQQGQTFLMDDAWLPPRGGGRPPHKYEAGVVHIIAGSEGLTGAAMMAAESAWGEGVGAVVLVCPRGVLDVFEGRLPQIIKKPVGSRDDVFFREEHLQEVREAVAEKEGPVLLGPGLGRQPTTEAFAAAFMKQTKRDLVLDADGLWALARQEQWDKAAGASWILTPHPGELRSLLDEDIEADHQRLEAARRFARNKKVTLLSKGYPAVVADPEGPAYLSGYDTRIFSRAGFGDILAGKIAGFRAMGDNPSVSCVRALLRGHRRAVRQQQQNDHPLEPLDLV